jgi:tRNA U34 5-carboxymethylaminomethyl modifying enzyme MnmG/GidA
VFERQSLSESVVPKIVYDKLVVSNLHTETELKLKKHIIETQEIEIKQLKQCLKDVANSTQTSLNKQLSNQKQLQKYVDKMIHEMEKKSNKICKVLSDLSMYSHRPYFLREIIHH